MNTQFFEIFWLDNIVWGVPLEQKPTNQYRKEYDNCFNLSGKTACFFLVTSDESIGRKDAINFAAAVAAGKVVRHHIDLSSLQGVRKKGR